jgi:ankyrin repeat protein
MRECSVDSFMKKNAYRSFNTYSYYCDINALDNNGNSILKLATMLGNVKLVRWALKKNADPHIGDALSLITFPNVSEPCMPSDQVCKNEKSMLEMLDMYYSLSHLNDSIITNLAFLTAIKHLNYRYFNSLLNKLYEKKKDFSYIDSHGNNYIQIALVWGNYNTAEWLLKKNKVNINNRNNYNISTSDMIINDQRNDSLTKYNLMKIIAKQTLAR